MAKSFQAIVRLLRGGLRRALRVLRNSQEHDVTLDETKAAVTDAAAIIEQALEDAKDDKDI